MITEALRQPRCPDRHGIVNVRSHECLSVSRPGNPIGSAPTRGLRPLIRPRPGPRAESIVRGVPVHQPGSTRSRGWIRWRNLPPSADLSVIPAGWLFRGAGGNRTPVHQPVNELATTIPGVATDAVTPTGRLSARGGPRTVVPESQRSFLPSAVFPAVIPHFCCRAVMDWPRAALLLTMTLLPSEMNQAARANCSSAILWVAPFSESEQLGSQTRPTVLMSKPVSPEIVPGNGM